MALRLTEVKEGLRGHVVVELSDLDNEVPVKLVGGELVETIVAHDFIGHLMIQCARQPGLAQVLDAFLCPGSELWMYNNALEGERKEAYYCWSGPQQIGEHVQ